MTDNVVSRLKSNRVQGRRRGPSRRGTSEWDTPGVYYADLTLGDRATTVKLLVREHKRDSGIHVRYLYTTDLSLSEEEAWRMRWEIEDLQGTSRPLDSSFWRRERLQGYLTIFTVTNVVRELVGELNLGSVEAFLRLSSAL